MNNTVIGLILGIGLLVMNICFMIICIMIIRFIMNKIAKKYIRLYETEKNNCNYEKALLYIRKGKIRTNAPDFFAFENILYFHSSELQKFVELIENNPKKLNKCFYELIMPSYKIANYILDRDNKLTFTFDKMRIDLILISIEKYMQDPSEDNAKTLTVNLQNDKREPVIMFVYCVSKCWNSVETLAYENQLKVIGKWKNQDIYLNLIRKLQENKNKDT